MSRPPRNRGERFYRPPRNPGERLYRPPRNRGERSYRPPRSRGERSYRSPRSMLLASAGNGSHALRGERFHRPQRIMPSANNHRVKWADWDWPVPTVFANGSTAGLVRDCRRDHAAGRQSANPKQSAYMTRVVIPCVDVGVGLCTPDATEGVPV